MSGSNTINTATVLLETGIVPMSEPVTGSCSRRPPGRARHRRLPRRALRARHIRERPSFATHLDAPVQCPGLGELTVDVAYGGAFCAFVDAEALGYAIVPEEARELAELGERIRPARREQLGSPTPPSRR